MDTTINNYVFRALESYPYDLEEVIESLHYALSYDDKNTMALTLMGRVYAEKLYKYETAISYYKKALSESIYAFEVYPHYINVLLWNEDYKQVEDFIDFAITVKGADKSILYLKKAILYEKLKEYKKAVSFIKLSKEYTYNTDFMEEVKQHENRIKEKLPKKKKSKKRTLNKK